MSLAPRASGWSAVRLLSLLSSRTRTRRETKVRYDPNMRESGIDL
ncbi:hypothetical protein Rhow_004128 [Rhodococcus wratislaviensis]|uniref:Uncharacterized protein n=1 Tax=Rhodococcus wratislaviensis TaxID=44752 RepID=A0A402CA26_RHOWR|nr:hypothetical protein Rhow_004128 [Rhodococcus wratislaviensis]